MASDKLGAHCSHKAQTKCASPNTQTQGNSFELQDEEEQEPDPNISPGLQEIVDWCACPPQRGHPAPGLCCCCSALWCSQFVYLNLYLLYFCWPACTSAGLPALLLACPVMQPLLSPPPGLKLPDCRAAYGCSLPAGCLLLSALRRRCSFLAHGVDWGVIRQLCGLTHGIESIMRQPASIPCQHRAAVQCSTVGFMSS